MKAQGDSGERPGAWAGSGLETYGLDTRFRECMMRLRYERRVRMDTQVEEIASLWRDLRMEMIRITEAARDLYAWLDAHEPVPETGERQ